MSNQMVKNSTYILMCYKILHVIFGQFLEHRNLVLEKIYIKEQKKNYTVIVTKRSKNIDNSIGNNLNVTHS